MTSDLLENELGRYHPRATIRATITTTPAKRSACSSDYHKEHRLTELARNKRKEYNRREQEKLRKEREEIKACSFHPLTRQKNSSSPESEISNELFERLALEAVEREKRREAKRRKKEEEEKSKYSFVPKTRASRFIDEDKYLKPEEKAMLLLKEKQERLKQLEKKHQELDVDLTFHPQISEESQRIAKNQKDKFNIYERARYSENQKRLKRQTENQLHDKFEECTFQPHVNPNTEKILLNSDLIAASFFERQKLFKIKEQNDKQLMHDKENRYLNTLFQPRINKTSEVLHTIFRGAETEEERFERLSRVDSEKREKKQQIVRDEYYEQFVFQPQLNPISKQIGQATDPEELVKNDRNKVVKQYVTDVCERAWHKEHTFKPTLVANSIEQSRKYKLIDPTSPEITTDNIEKYHEKREQKLEIVKKELQEKELKECTFNPTTNKSSRRATPTKSGPIVIRGLSKHLERSERAKKIEEEKKDREEKVFRPRITRPDPKLKYTIPTPFKNLHPDNYGAQREVKRLELLEKYHRALSEQLAN